MVKKMLRTVKSCIGFSSPRNRDLGNGLSSIPFERLFASGPQSSRSLNGASSIRSSSDVGVSDPSETVNTALAKLETLICDLREPVTKKSTIAKQFQDVQTYCRSNVPQLGLIFDKFGAAANGQVLPVTGRINKNEHEGFRYQELSTILRGVGHLHWMGALFALLAVVLDRWDKVSKRSEKLLEHLGKLKRFAEHVLELHDMEQDSGSSGPSKSVQAAIEVILDHADYCSRGVKESFLQRFLCADVHNEGLVKLGDDLQKLYPELNLSAQLMHKEPSGETFELTDDTVVMGEVEKRVDEALQKLKSNDNALILRGMLGTGKSTLGLKVARQLKEKRNIDKRQCCKILMRGDTGIKVTKKQEELYSKLHKRGVKKDFSDFRQGQRELTNLFKSIQAKPLLLLFDDANCPEDLEKLLPDNLRVALHPGSILLVTTTHLRVMSVLRKKGVACQDYEVNVIEKKEAQALLLKKILGDQDVLLDFPVARHLMQSEHFKKLLDLCDGVPLAINAVASFVRERGQDFLSFRDSSSYNLPFEEAYSNLDSDGKEEFLSKLTKATIHAYEVLSSGDPISTEQSALRRDLDFTFEQLNSHPRIRDVFLDIVAVHLGGKWGDVQLACGEEDLEALEQLSIVKRCNGTSGVQEPVVQVHHLLIGLSHKLENTEECRGRRVVVENVDRLPECFLDGQCADVYNRVKLLKVDQCKQVFTAAQLDRVTCNLRYLELHGTTIDGKSPTVPPRLTYFKSRQSSFPFALSPDLKYLEVLDVEGTWDNEVIESMPNLQKLKVENSSSLRSLGPGLKKLTTVAIVSCPTFESIEGLDSAVVRHLVIVNCPNFRDFSNVTKLKWLKRLSLASFECQPPNLPTQKPTPFTRFPEELVIPSGVQILDLSRNSNLEELPTFASSKTIKKLNLRFCSALKQFGKERLGLTSLQYLHLEGCAALEVLDVRGYETLDRSELLQTIEFMKAKNPDFKLIIDEDGGPRWWAALQWCIQLPFRKTRSLIEKVKSRSERRSLDTCYTFPGGIPPLSKPKYM